VQTLSTPSIPATVNVTGLIGLVLAIPAVCHPKYHADVPRADRYELLSYVQNWDAHVLGSRLLDFFWGSYVGPDPEADTRHSPLLWEDLSGLPPTGEFWGREMEKKTFLTIADYIPPHPKRNTPELTMAFSPSNPRVRQGPPAR
jgi:hypothetical protein